MINEVLYMETRVFRKFCNRFKLDASEGNRLFNMFNIWEYIE